MSLERTPAAADAGPGALFQLLRDGIPRTRAELAAESGLARTAAALRLESLLRTGLVRPVEPAVSSGGRPPARFALDPTSRVVVAVDAGARHTRVAVVDLSGRVREERTWQSDITDGPEPILDRILDEATASLLASGHAAEQVLAVGIGLPGPVEFAIGRPSNPPIMPGWHDYDVPAHIRRRIPSPVLVDNDVNVMALGERATSWPDTDDLVFVKVATGIGSGIISGGRLQRGARGIAGDIGHIRVARDPDAPCRCGNTGCLEAVAASPAVARRLSAGGLGVTGSADIVGLVRAGDPDAVDAVHLAGQDIGDVLSACISLTNPSVVVIGGSLSQAEEPLLSGIREVVAARGTPLATAGLQIVPSVLGARAGVVGAATLALDEALSPARIDALTGAAAR
ncbi:ROK family transcriptional regulator [Herbiconiux sp. L3-i23]|uniref:ROK family transcriptional regulator n=1 Tax=Herbiconiux sp. L3-i23 TaxID=2905871 RepID=UPI002045F8C9|nr:ROK family protein [Herbiconiux sp. L3-i23]BDI21775.1 sugar kinase [Herbiconiux sp. L3-i23]